MSTVVRHVGICRNSSCTEGVQEQVQERAHSHLQLSENDLPQAPLDRKPLLRGSKVLRGMQYHTWVLDTLHLGWLQ